MKQDYITGDVVEYDNKIMIIKDVGTNSLHYFL